MANRSNHYEAAFEALHPVAPGAVRGRRRGQAGAFRATTGSRIPDFLLYPRLGPNLVVEVKGKRGKNAEGRRPWENWVTTDDLDGLARWQEMFGPGFRAILAFAYAEPLPPFPLPRDERSVRVPGPRRIASGRSGSTTTSPTSGREGPAWKAVAMARAAFRRRVRPLREWLPMTVGIPETTPDPSRTATDDPTRWTRTARRRWPSALALTAGRSAPGRTPRTQPAARSRGATARAGRSTATSLTGRPGRRSRCSSSPSRPAGR